MNINVITYNIPHRKTQDVIKELLYRGYKDITLVEIPFIKRKNPFKPLFKHRPDKCIDVDPYKLAERLQLNHAYYCEDEEYAYPTLIAGAGILKQTGLINSHPGYLPNVRGLDALKWAIYEGQIIGVTTHLTTMGIDEGIEIEKRIIPVYYEDSFYELCMRIYETEIEMLVDAIEKPAKDEIKNYYYQIHRRMSHIKEVMMMERFDEIRKKGYIKKL